MDFLVRILTSEPLDVAIDPFPSGWNARTKRISKISRLNYCITAAAD
ncbi:MULTISPECIES: hypothetical protein [unclassified Mesorhizobium]|nr:hypothetical protein [Mesorhizobium sp. LSJC268A00]